jgi:mannonate dehydratase
MIFAFRWYGPNDPVSLEHIRQIPGIKGIMASVWDVPVGEVWPLDKILAVKKPIEEAGLIFSDVESIFVHEDIILGLPSRDRYIENYAQSVRNLGQAGVPVVIYNFMPLFDWYRSELAAPLPDGSNSLAYRQASADALDPVHLGDADLPAWAGDFSPKRIKELFGLYEGITEEDLWHNLAYFLEAVVPAAEEAGVKLAIHPDDPPWPIFGLPRIITSEDALARLLGLVDSPANGLAICSGSLGAGRDNDLPRIIRRFGDRINSAHVRNVLHLGGGTDFQESAHPSQYGSLDVYEIMKAYYDVGYDGSIRPDHGRMIWDEKGTPGYGLYDRALGATYLLGLWEAISKTGR